MAAISGRVGRAVRAPSNEPSGEVGVLQADDPAAQPLSTAVEEETSSVDSPSRCISGLSVAAPFMDPVGSAVIADWTSRHASADTSQRIGTPPLQDSSSTAVSVVSAASSATWRPPDGSPAIASSVLPQSIRARVTPPMATTSSSSVPTRTLLDGRREELEAQRSEVDGRLSQLEALQSKLRGLGETLSDAMDCGPGSMAWPPGLPEEVEATLAPLLGSFVPDVQLSEDDTAARNQILLMQSRLEACMSRSSPAVTNGTIGV